MWFCRKKEIQQLAWCIAELAALVGQQEEQVSANSDAIEAVVANLKAAEARINEKLSALQTAVDNGEDLSAPLADLTAEVGNISNIAPDAPPAV